ncbi:transposase [Salicibibacter cibi]|uniref:Transposase n=1 Tax=Salicibibacter cibi TaxID=2743001 RepID=A0A7T7CEA2_9BACI|nr:transposase [Salicibibacter cibi]QQK78844.1 transposase [Salicibibacter cibi]
MGRPTLQQLLTYVSKVYGIGEKIKRAKDGRKDPQIMESTICCVMLLGFVWRMKSLNQLNQWLKYGRFKKLLPGVRLPRVDAVRESLSQYDLEPLQEMHDGIIHKAKRNKVFQQGTMNGWVVVGLDGVELFESKVKNCDECLTREKDGETHDFHRGVACMTVGSDPHVILGIDHMHPRDGEDKDEGEQTVGKRLIRNLYDTHRHFADVIVGDALYVNAPFINDVRAIGMDAVIRVKNKRLHLVQDALGLFQHREADEHWSIKDPEPKAKRKKQKQKHIHVEAWDEEGFEMGGVPQPVRFLRFRETITENKYRGKNVKRVETTKEVWVVTTLGKHVPAKHVWEMIHERWDVENNGFRELKTKWNIHHCFMHHPRAIEAILMFMMIAINLFHLFIFRRVKDFRKKGITQSFLVEELRIDAVLQDVPLYALLE